MGEKAWVKGKGGIFARTPTRGPWSGQRVYCARVWVRSLHRFRYFTLGAKLKAAQTRLSVIKADPDKALKERQERAPALATFGQVLDAFLAGYRSRGGTDYYRQVLKSARGYFGDGPVTDLTTAGLDGYLEQRRSLTRNNDGERKVGESSLRKELIALGTCLKWAKRRALVPQNPVADYERPKDPGQGTPSVLSSEQEQALQAKCAPWLGDVVEWALYSGMRLGEITRLSWRGIDRKGSVIHVEGTKTGKSRTIPLGLSLRLSAVLARNPQRTDTDLVFHDLQGRALDVDVLNRALRSAMNGAKLDAGRGTRWNVLRHSFITRLAATGRFSPYEVADMAGNSPQVIEKHYRHHFPMNQERAAGALDAKSAGAPQSAPRDAAIA